MDAQTKQQESQTVQQEIATFDNFNAAQKAKQLLQESELALRSLSIDGEIDNYEKLAAMGTVVGAEAGIIIGAFYGGTLGIIAVSMVSTLLNGAVINSPLNYGLITGFTIAGGLVGAIAGNRIRSNSLPEQKTKGNVDAPRRFQLIVEGQSSDITKAQEMLGYPVSS